MSMDVGSAEMGMDEWCRRVPKVELHAHLNGSIRDSTLLELARERSKKGDLVLSDVEGVILKDDRSLQECFKLFDLIHVLTTDHGTISRITKEVIEDFAAENVIYLELRTTPKKNEAIGMSKRSYVEAVLAGFKAVETVEAIYLPSDGSIQFPGEVVQQNNVCRGSRMHQIFVRLLLSIDRRDSLDGAMETVQLALEMRNTGVVGIDLSGNPVVGHWQTFLPALTWARKQGLPITLHCGEVPNRQEIQGMLKFHPERLGHVCCLEDLEWKTLKESDIPVEVCLTSNVRTECVTSIADHHFADLYRVKHPLILCTDDPGVFSTTISREYALAASCFDLTKMELFQLAKHAVNFIFADNKMKETLRLIIEETECNLLMPHEHVENSVSPK
uniref:TSA: Wollemia nobilis Ref_Wollemi_Transcript_9671_1593 transcribed RNA sequence n=1 Tax=Wollemia nobilis TaxID=56998 RepID=A0A0C9RW55_9CONI